LSYSLTFKIVPDLPQHSQSYLPKHIRFDSPDRLVICLEQEQDESNEDLITRAEWEIQRELLRIHVFQGIVYTSTYIAAQPLLSRAFRLQASPGWMHHPIAPKLARCQELWTPSIETKLVLWGEVQRENLTPQLRYAYLYMICEIDGVHMDWDYKSGQNPTPFEEIKIIRNLLLHSGDMHPRVKKYLSRKNIDHQRNIQNLQIYTKLATDRLHAVLTDVWKLLLNDLGYVDTKS